MAAPVGPDEFAAVVPQPGESLATAVHKVFLRLPVLVYKFVKWKYGGQYGSLGSGFVAMVCNVCPKEEEQENQSQELTS